MFNIISYQGNANKNHNEGFPGGAVVTNLPANAGDRFEPWSRKIPHAAEQLSPCTTIPSLRSRARKPQLLKAACLEPVFRNKRSPRSLQLKKAYV